MPKRRARVASVAALRISPEPSFRALKITLRSQGQEQVLKVVANSQGEDVFNAVPVATYTLTVEAQSFGGCEVKDLAVSAGTNAKADAILHPASENVSVSVEAEGSTIDVRSATIATVIDSTLVENLPLDGNNAVNVAALLPGVTDVNAPTTFTNDTAGPSYEISGSRANQNLFLLEGALYNNLYNNTGLNFSPRHALEEVSSLLNNFKAQYGRNVGSVFNVITKAGTGSFHGELWEFVQNKGLNASDYLSHVNPHLVQNQFGATLGGPVFRGKVNFFIAYQDLRSAATVTATDFTPTYSERGFLADGMSSRPCTFAFGFGTTRCAAFTEDNLTTNTSGQVVAGTLKLTNPIKASFRDAKALS